MIRAGTTTVVGCLGTDGVTRRMENLIAKAKQLKDEGVSCYIYTGSYDVPVRTFLADIRSDLLFIDEVIGVGEIAIADHRSSQPAFEEFVRIVADTRVGGMLSGKGGVVNIHMGDDGQMLEYLERVKVETPLPAYHMIPTHMNRNPLLFERGITYAKGAVMDFTTSSYASFQEEGELKSSDGLKKMLDAGVPIEHITFSSDGQGSLPVFNREGENIDVQVARVDTLYQEVRDAVRQENIPWRPPCAPSPPTWPTTCVCHARDGSGRGTTLIWCWRTRIRWRFRPSLPGGRSCFATGNYWLKAASNKQKF